MVLGHTPETSCLTLVLKMEVWDSFQFGMKEGFPNKLKKSYLTHLANPNSAWFSDLCLPLNPCKNMKQEESWEN